MKKPPLYDPAASWSGPRSRGRSRMWRAWRRRRGRRPRRRARGRTRTAMNRRMRPPRDARSGSVSPVARRGPGGTRCGPRVRASRNAAQRGGRGCHRQDANGPGRPLALPIGQAAGLGRVELAAQRLPPLPFLRVRSKRRSASGSHSDCRRPLISGAGASSDGGLGRRSTTSEEHVRTKAQVRWVMDRISNRPHLERPTAAEAAERTRASFQCDAVPRSPVAPPVAPGRPLALPIGQARCDAGGRRYRWLVTFEATEVLAHTALLR